MAQRGRPAKVQVASQNEVAQAMHPKGVNFKQLPQVGPKSGQAPTARSAMQTMLMMAKAKGGPDLGEIQPLPPDSDFIRASKLLGVQLLVTDCVMTQQDWGDGPKPQAVYTIYIISREDVGKRKTALGSRAALAQATALLAKEEALLHGGVSVYPFITTMTYGEQTGSFSPPIIWREVDVETEADVPYYHEPWGESAPLSEGEQKALDSGL